MDDVGGNIWQALSWGASGPCIDRSQGGLCVKRTDDKGVESMSGAVQKLAEELLFTLQEGVGEEDGRGPHQ